MWLASNTWDSERITAVRIFSQMRYVKPHDDSNLGKYGWDFQPLLERRYGLEHLYVYYAKCDPDSLVFDPDDIRDKFVSDIYPPDVFVLLNFEGPAWESVEAISTKLVILKMIKAARPDLELAFYRHPPGVDYWVVSDSDELHYRLLNYAEIIEAQDVLVPGFYFGDLIYDCSGYAHHITAELLYEWISSALEAIANEFPAAELRPILWPTNQTWWSNNRDSDQVGYAWREDLIVASHVRGELWCACLDALRPYCESLIVWGQGHRPWDSRFPWFVETMRFLRGM